MKDDLPRGCHITYQLQYRTCGKDACSVCRAGGAHGPYWYAYWREQTGMRSAYVGKVAPPPCVCPRCSATLGSALLTQRNERIRLSLSEEEKASEL
jgi:hypothetical protein